MSDSQRWRTIGLVTFLVAGFLLLSWGGAIVAAPGTIPLMWIAASRHATRPFRVAATMLSTLTVAEVVWALTYLTVDEAQPWIWLLPGLAVLVVVAIARRSSEMSRSASDSPAA